MITQLYIVTLYIYNFIQKIKTLQPIFTANYVSYNDNTTLFIDNMVTMTIYFIYCIFNKSNNPCREEDSISVRLFEERK